MTRIQIATAALQGLLASGHFTEHDDLEGPWFLIDPLAGQTEESPIQAVNAALRIADELIERAS